MLEQLVNDKYSEVFLHLIMLQIFFCLTEIYDDGSQWSVVDKVTITLHWIQCLQYRQS